MKDTGLSTKTIDTIKTILSAYSTINEAYIFGSRAKGNYKEGSDIDLCLKASSKFTYTDLLHIMSEFEESTLPYLFDVVIYDKVTNLNLKQHIDQVGLQIYSKVN